MSDQSQETLDREKIAYMLAFEIVQLWRVKLECQEREWLRAGVAGLPAVVTAYTLWRHYDDQ